MILLTNYQQIFRSFLIMVAIFHGKVLGSRLNGIIFDDNKIKTTIIKMIKLSTC